MAVCSRRADLVDEVASRVRELGRTSRSYTVDVADLDAGRRMLDDILSEWGGLDILVNNAGLLSAYRVEEMMPEQWDDLLGVNLRGAVFLTNAALGAMASQGSGSIIAIGSSLASIGGAGMDGVDYNISKVGLQAWIKTLAREVGPSGIRANGVACGAIDTPMHEKWRDALIAQWEPQVPLRRIGTAAEVADVAGFLASDASGYVTGQTIHVNGGLQGAYA